MPAMEAEKTTSLDGKAQVQYNSRYRNLFPSVFPLSEGRRTCVFVVGFNFILPPSVNAHPVYACLRCILCTYTL